MVERESTTEQGPRTMTEASPLQKVTDEAREHLSTCEQPLPRVLSQVITQIGPMMSTFESRVEERGLEQPTEDQPHYPELAMERRLGDIVTGVRSLQALWASDKYEPHPNLERTFRRKDSSQTELAPAIQIIQTDLELPRPAEVEEETEVREVDPELRGLSRAELYDRLLEAATVSRTRMKQDPSEIIAEAEKRIDLVTRVWEKSQTPGRVRIKWGRVQGRKFIPEDTELELEFRYSPEVGYTCTPQIISVTRGSEKVGEREQHLSVRGDAFPVHQFAEANVSSVNEALSLNQLTGKKS